jgi:hypothetical protein
MASPRTASVRKSPVGDPCDCVHHLATGPIAMPTCQRCFGTGKTDRRRDKTIKENRDLRIPNDAEIQAFNGAHGKRLYANTALDWRCPGCHRTKHELMRWTMLFKNTPHRYMGWAGGLHKHHDHGPRPVRFPETLMCEQCNSADGAAKRELRLPGDFSFSPSEISCFVIGTPHGWHLMNYLAAARLFVAVRPPVPPPPPPMFWPPGVPS